MNLTTVTKSVIDTLFRLGGEYVKAVTYIRPTGRAGETPLEETAQTNLACSAIVPSYAPAGFTFPHHWQRRVVFKAADMTTLAPLREGDFIVLPDGTRLDVFVALIDPTATIWICETRESLTEDYGDLTAHTTTADYGDLTAYGTSEDYGELF